MMVGQLKAVRGKMTIQKQILSAIYKDRPADLEQLMHQQCDVNHQNEYGVTPLMLAATHGHDQCIDVLLNFGKCHERVARSAASVWKEREEFLKRKRLWGGMGFQLYSPQLCPRCAASRLCLPPKPSRFCQLVACPSSTFHPLGVLAFLYSFLLCAINLWHLLPSFFLF